MDYRKHILQLVIVLAVLYYFLDALIGSLVYEELGFLDMLIASVPNQVLFTRLFAIVFMVMLGIIISYRLPGSKSKKEKSLVNYKFSSDPNLMVNVSNHIKTPLNAIQGFIEMLDDPNISENSKKLYVNHIRSSSKYLLELIRNVTDITLIESGSLYLDKSECKLNELLSDLHFKYGKQLKEKTRNNAVIRLKTNVKDENFSIIADCGRLKQVLENLLENSVNFTDEGIIEFGYLAREDDRIEFYLKDTGSADASERLKMLFDKTSTAVDSKLAPFDLAALRIRISIKLVELMGGELTSASSEYQGSEFRFSLPMKIHSIEKSEGIGSPLTEYDILHKEINNPDKQWSGKTILIAEDVESNFIYLSEILKETGVNILWAENGKIAYEMVMKNSNIDLILMDILMPEMDGYEATVLIKKELPDIPIIAQTAYHLEEGDYKDSRMYFSKVLIKPIWSYDLLNVLEEILDNH